jgi:hypothetical protein
MKIYKPKKKAHHCRRSRDSNIPLQISESKSEEAANQLQMGDSTFLDRMLLQLRSTCKYYSGYPKDLGPSRVLHFTSEREFVQLLHQGYPVVVAFTIR